MESGRLNAGIKESCLTCEHGHLLSVEEPCRSCDSILCWTPKREEDTRDADEDWEDNDHEL
jgi:hypothetical protein